MRQFLLFFALSQGISACGGSTPTTSGIDIEYHLERLNTNQTHNSILISANKTAANYTFSITGIGFSSDTPFDTKIPIQQIVNLDYNEEAIFSVGIDFFSGDGSTVISDTLSWEYSLEKPPKPILSFDELATNDTAVNLLLGGNLERKTTEIWLEGDLFTDPSGSWITIPSNLRVPINVSDNDGIKNLTVKYRNIYGNLSEEQAVSILKKSTMPINCDVKIPSTLSPSRTQRILLSATGSGTMIYSFTGDIDPFKQAQFEDEKVATISFTPSAGIKNFVAKMTDLAGNACPDFSFQVEYTPGAINYGVHVQNDPVYVDDINITLFNDFSFLSVDQPQMYISGSHVIENSDTQKWVDFKKEVEIQLTETDGLREIHAQYKLNPTAEPTETVFTTVYLRPKVKYSNSKVIISQIDAMEKVTITGCEIAYTNVDYQKSYECTPTGSKITATFLFKDGSSTTKTCSSI